MDRDTFYSLTTADVNVTNELFMNNDVRACLRITDNYMQEVMKMTGDVPTFCLFMYTLVQRHIVKFVLRDDAESCLTFICMACMNAHRTLAEYKMSYLIEYIFLPTEDNLIENPQTFTDHGHQYLVEVACWCVLVSLTGQLGKISEVIHDRFKAINCNIAKHVISDVTARIALDSVTVQELQSMCE